MKTMILAAFAALILSAGIAQAAQAAIQTSAHQGPYDTSSLVADSSGNQAAGIACAVLWGWSAIRSARRSNAAA